MEPLSRKWKDAKRKKLEYYIANINLECWVQYKAILPIDCIQPYLITNMSNSFTLDDECLVLKFHYRIKILPI